MTLLDQQAVPTPRATLGINVASTLCWVWGALMVLSSVAVAIPMIAMNRSLLVPAILLVLAMVLCYAGYGLRKGRRAAAWTAVVACGLIALMQVGNVTGVAILGLICNVTVVTLVILNWRHFQRPSVGA